MNNYNYEFKQIYRMVDHFGKSLIRTTKIVYIYSVSKNKIMTTKKFIY